jgi:large subunit ribosomal protein L21
MYAIVKTGGKQYRVEEGQSLLVERLPADDGAKVGLEPLLYVDGSNVVDGDDLAKVKVEARVLGHERGPKLRIVKFKPKRGYKRRTGHRQELTRLEVTSVKLAARRSAAKPAAEKAEAAPKPVAAEPAADKAEAPKPAASKAAAPKPAAKPRATKPAAAKPKPPARKPRTTKTEDDDGA